MKNLDDHDADHDHDDDGAGCGGGGGGGGGGGNLRSESLCEFDDLFVELGCTPCTKVIYIYRQQSYPVHISANLMCPAKEQRSSAFAVPAVLLGDGSVEVRPTLANVNCWPMGDPCLVGNLYIEPHLVLENSVEIWYIRPMTVSSLQ